MIEVLDGTAMIVPLTVNTPASLCVSSRDTDRLIASAHGWLVLTSSWLFQLHCLSAILSISWHHTLHFLLSNLQRGKERERARERDAADIGDFKCGCAESFPINAPNPACIR